MSYDTLRNSVRGVLQTIEETKGYNNGRVTVEEHPWGADDMMTVSAVLGSQVVGALILQRAGAYEPHLRIWEVNMTTFERRGVGFHPVNHAGTFDTHVFARHLFDLLDVYLGPTAAELERQREATDLDARAQATRPRVVPQVSPASTGGFDLVLHGLTANDVLRAVEALPEVSQPGSSRTILDHLLADEL